MSPVSSRRPRSGAARAAPTALGGVGSDDRGGHSRGEEESLELKGRRGGRSHRGDELPFEVRVISPPPRTLGKFNLHPRTQCGDIIEIGRRAGAGGVGDGEEEAEAELVDAEMEEEEEKGGVRRTEAYVVKRVRNRFVWTREPGGVAGPRMSKKTLEIKSLARKSVESYLERTLRES